MSEANIFAWFECINIQTILNPPDIKINKKQGLEAALLEYIGSRM